VVDPFGPLLAHRGFVLFDGALATELEKKGADLSGSLWSARLLRDDPELIVKVHREAIEAGADVISTASYQVSREGFVRAGLSAADADAALRTAVTLARRAGPGLVAASLGPYGATLADGSEYRGDYALPEGFHRPRVEAVLEAGPDLVLFETLPSLAEAEAVAALAEEHRDVAFMASFSAAAPFARVVRCFEGLHNVVAVGVNCVPPQAVVPLLESARRTNQRLAAQPNSGETWDAKARAWRGAPEGQGLADWAPKYRAAGATVFGGCCRTTPADIAAARAALSARP